MAINRNALTQNAEELDANGMPLNAIRNNLTGMMTRLQSGPSSGVSLDYSRPMIQLANGKKGYYGKDDPSSVYDAEGNKLSTLIADVSAHNAAQDRAYQLQKQQMDLETGRLHQQRMQQELTQGRAAPPGYRFTQDGNMEPIPGGPADYKITGDAVKARADSNAVLDLVGEAETVLPKAHGSGIGSAVGWAANALGIENDKNNADAQLKVIAGGLVSKMPKMSGPQSDKDVQLYREMAGQVGDSTLPIGVRQAALNQMRSIHSKYSGQQPQQSDQPVNPTQAVSDARSAILRGAPKDAVIRLLEEKGITNHGIK